MATSATTEIARTDGKLSITSHRRAATERLPINTRRSPPPLPELDRNTHRYIRTQAQADYRRHRYLSWTRLAKTQETG